MTDGPVEMFLAELGRHLRRDDATRRRVVSEVGDHLRDLVAEGRVRGLDEHAAELAAVERFGSPRALARSLRQPRRFGGAVRVLSGVAVAGGCVALALTVSAVRSPTSPRATPISARGGALPATNLPHWCVAALEDIRGRHPDQALVELDPRTGAILSWGRLRYTPTAVCHLAPAPVRIGGVWYATSDPAAPFG